MKKIVAKLLITGALCSVAAWAHISTFPPDPCQCGVCAPANPCSACNWYDLICWANCRVYDCCVCEN